MHFVVIGAVLGGIGVMAGAFGAHGLQDVLEPKYLAIFETAVRYQMYHALALVGIGLLPQACRSTALAGWSMVTGTIVFSGSLYTLALSGVDQWGAVTPIGGMLLIVGWGVFAVAAWQRMGARQLRGQNSDPVNVCEPATS